MSGPDFFQTRMGQKFFDDTMPKLVDHLGRLNKTLETTAGRLNTTLEAIAAMLRNDRDVHGTADIQPTAELLEIASKHLRIDSFEPQGADRLDFRQVHVAAVGAALQAAYRAGIAAGVRHISLDDPGSPDRER